MSRNIFGQKVILSTDNDEPCVCSTDFTCLADDHEPNPYYDDDAEVAAAFDEIEQHRAEPEAIVRALAALDAPLDSEFGECKLCKAESRWWGERELSEHEADCPWRRAKEWVDAS